MEGIAFGAGRSLRVYSKLGRGLSGAETDSRERGDRFGIGPLKGMVSGSRKLTVAMSLKKFSRDSSDARILEWHSRDISTDHKAQSPSPGTPRGISDDKSAGEPNDIWYPSPFTAEAGEANRWSKISTEESEWPLSARRKAEEDALSTSVD